jgi:malonyl-CoA/methylmalonyl-CoA synthetase
MAEGTGGANPYGANWLGARLRAASVGREAAAFAEGLSYGALWAGAERMAAALVAAGARPGDRVAVQVEKSLAALELYLGSLLAGAVFVPLNPAYTAAEIGRFLADAEPAVFVCDPARAASLAPLAGAAAVLTLGADGAGTLAAAAAGQGGFAAVPRGPDDLAGILYTSGTTGRAKGAMLSHDNLASNAAVLAGLWLFGPGDVLIHVLPIFHTHGLFVATHVTLVSGGQVIWMPRFDPGAVLAAFGRASALMGVPTVYARLLEQPGLTRDAVAGMRLFVSGSAPLAAETHRRWQARTGTAILERYGMTETSMITSNPYDGARLAGTVGFALPGVELRVADPATGATLPAGAVGSVELRGPNVFKGYWRMPEKTAAEFRTDGFFVTGDLGVLDGEGRLTLVGRAKDLVITGGFNVYPAEVEAAIDVLPGVRESAVIGLPHPDLGEAVAAVVVPEPGAAVDAGAILAALAGRLARFKLPRRVFLADALPRNAMGKVQKAELRARHADAFAAGASDLGASEMRRNPGGDAAQP